jgi:hypothetical protein
MNYRALAATLLLISAGPVAQAGTVTVVAGTIKLIAPADTVAQNSPFTVNLVLDASDPLIPGTRPGTFSGEVIVNFDITKLTYTGFTLANDLSYYISPVVATNGNTRTVRLGFNGAAEVGTVGTFAFTAIGSPGSVATIGLADGDPVPGAGSFVNTDPTNQRFIPTPTGAQVTIVPAPAGVWLLGTAVGALVIRRRLRNAAA